MIDIAGCIAKHLAVDILVIVKGKNVRIALVQAFFALGFGNFLADVLQNAGPF
jgi:hypothetical protein